MTRRSVEKVTTWQGTCRTGPWVTKGVGRAGVGLEFWLRAGGLGQTGTRGRVDPYRHPNRRILHRFYLIGNLQRTLKIP